MSQQGSQRGREGLRRVARGPRYPTTADPVGTQVASASNLQDMLPLWLLGIDSPGESFTKLRTLDSVGRSHGRAVSRGEVS